MVLKRAFADRVVLGAAFFVVLFGATLVAAIPIYVNAVGQSGLRERLARAPVTEANLEATAPVSSGGDFATLDRTVSGLAREAFAPAGGAAVHRSGESEPFASGGRTVVLGFFDGIPYLVEPGLDLAFYTGSGSNPIAVPWLAPVLFAVGVAALAVVFVIVAGVRMRRARLDQVLRIGER